MVASRATDGVGIADEEVSFVGTSDFVGAETFDGVLSPSTVLPMPLCPNTHPSKRATARIKTPSTVIQGSLAGGCVISLTSPKLLGESGSSFSGGTIIVSMTRRE